LTLRSGYVLAPGASRIIELPESSVMPSGSRVWGLILAAGDGKRLESLTTLPGGAAIPKQYCSLRAGPSLLQDALQRALAVATQQHTCVVVAEKHRRWWTPQLQLLPAANVIVQPENRGTAMGILLPLLHLLERDPGARLVILPADHHVRMESCLAHSMRAALEALPAKAGQTLLLGVTPEGPDPELGYIVPGSAGPAELALPVQQFVEKPSLKVARALIEHGALWNTFIVAASIGGLLRLYECRVPQIVAAMRQAVRRDRATAGAARAVAALYTGLQPMDFSRDVLPGQESSIRVVRVPPCGWSDLGTPERVARTLRCGPGDDARTSPRWHAAPGQRSQLSLAEQHARHATEAGRAHPPAR
jgi:mannose-1-phosphate guanylyltransferase